MLVLFADTDNEITPEFCKKYDYHLISMPYSVDGQEYLPYESFDVFEYHEYYEKLRNGAMTSTSSISMQNYIDYFEPVFAAGNDILYAHFSAQMSKTFDQMNLAYEELKEKYPERKLYAIDTKSISISGMSLLIDISKMAKEGKSPEEIAAFTEEEANHTAMYMMSSDLQFFKRSGRVSGISAFVGGLAGIRPIIYMTADGKLEPCGKERGKVNAMNRLFKYMDELGDDVGNHRIIIAHTDDEPTALEIKKRILEKFGEQTDVTIIVANPTIGAHCGPSTVGFTFHSKHR